VSLHLYLIAPSASGLEKRCKPASHDAYNEYRRNRGEHYRERIHGDLHPGTMFQGFYLECWTKRDIHCGAEPSNDTIGRS
jgi:hypothetical protein